MGQVWNPHLPVLWWLVTIVAAWAVVTGDRAMVLVLVFAASLCARTHVSYVVPVGALLVFVATVMAIDAWRRPQSRRRDLIWLGSGIGTLVVMWIPVLYDEVAHDPGNLTLLWRYFTDLAAPPIGWGCGFEVVLQHLDPVRVVSGHFWGDGQGGVGVTPSGSIVPGLLVVIVWIAAAATSRLLDDRELRWFHATAAVALGGSIVAANRIVPPVWYWVAMFLWVVQVTLLAAIGWTAVAAARRWVPGPSVVTAMRVRTGALARSWSSPSCSSPRRSPGPASVTTQKRRSCGRWCRRPSPRWPAAWRRVEGAPASTTCRGTTRRRSEWVATHSSTSSSGPASTPVWTPSSVSRCGRTGCSPMARRPPMSSSSAASTSTGAMAVAGAVEVARLDARSDAERSRFDADRAALISELQQEGRSDLVAQVDENLPLLVFGDFSDRIHALAIDMQRIGVPMAVVVSPLAPMSSTGGD